jgi:transcriptional regulator with XRE-family HTH domain
MTEFMDLLEKQGVTVRRVATALDISERAVYFWFSGSRKPRLSIAQVQALCNLLDCTVHDLPIDFSQANPDTTGQKQ